MKKFNKPVGILELLSGQVVPPGGHFVDSPRLLEPQAALWGQARTTPGILSLGPVGWLSMDCLLGKNVIYEGFLG